MTENERLIAGRYRIGQLVGRGGMAEVYEGYDTRLGRTVAIKLLKSDLANDASFEAKFRQEAQASARMAHPTIVRVYDAGEEETTDENGNPRKTPYIVMEFVKGRLLKEIIFEGGVELERSIRYVGGILTALEVSHRAGVVHRDIKPANVMVGDGDNVKVMDFGIARAVSDNSATQAATAGIIGTAQYFSPEQARGEAVDARTDLYSTGVILYELLAGRPPFKGESAVSVAYQHVSEAAIPPSQFNPAVSAELDAVVARAMAKDRNERFQSAEEFREHLLAAAQGKPVTNSNPIPISAPVTEVLSGPTKLMES
ncbi:MAG: Stk1 family Ser/Thr kinase, partial [Actinomycetota bacterium]